MLPTSPPQHLHRIFIGSTPEEEASYWTYYRAYADDYEGKAEEGRINNIAQGWNKGL